MLQLPDGVVELVFEVSVFGLELLVDGLEPIAVAVLFDGLGELGVDGDELF